MDLLNCNLQSKKKLLLDLMITITKLIALCDILNLLIIASFNNSNFPSSNSNNNRILQCIQMYNLRWSRTKRVILVLRINNQSFQERKHIQHTVNYHWITIIMKVVVIIILMDVIRTDSNKVSNNKYRISVDWMIISRTKEIILILVWISVLTCD